MVKTKLTIISSFIVLVWFIFQWNIGIDLSDEGFLWYGSIQTLMGKVPLLDFQSYDPGRYYWVAIWFKLLHSNNIFALRVAVTTFLWVSVFFGLLTIHKYIRTIAGLCLVAIIIIVWMSPNYRYFDSGIGLIAVYFLKRYIERPIYRNLFIIGFYVGLAAFFGKNHGLYLLFASLLVIVFMWYKVDRINFRKKLLIWGSGIVIGFSPMLFMFVYIKGFFHSFLTPFIQILRIGSTNIALPIPWPWIIHVNGPFSTQFQYFSIALFFLIIPIYCLIYAYRIIRLKANDISDNAILISSISVSVLYCHYAFSRADQPHLATVAPAFLIGALYILRNGVSLKNIMQMKYKKNILMLFLFLVFSFFAAIKPYPYYLKIVHPQGMKAIEITGEKIWIDSSTAQLIERVKSINNIYINNNNLVITPYWTTFYPILNRQAPWWDIYSLFPETKSRQEEMIKELQAKNINSVIMGNSALDGRDELRFINTHPLIYKYFQDNFLIEGVSGLPQDYQFLQKTDLQSGQYDEFVLSPNKIANRVENEINVIDDSRFTLKSTGNDSELIWKIPDNKQIQFISLEFDELPKITVHGQIYWSTDIEAQLSEDKSVNFNLNPNTKVYKIDLSKTKNIKSIRVDLGDVPNQNFTIKSIKLITTR